MYSFCRASNEYRAFMNLPQITPNWVSKKSLDAHTSCHEWIPDGQNSFQFHSAPNWETTMFTTWGSLLEPGLDWIAWALATQMCKILVWQTCHKDDRFLCLPRW